MSYLRNRFLYPLHPTFGQSPARAWLESFFRAVDRVGTSAFDEVIKEGDACKAAQLVREAINI